MIDGGNSARMDAVTANIKDSLSLKVALVGIVLAVIGFLVQDGAIPAFMVIWGIALFFIGTLFHLTIQYNRS